MREKNQDEYDVMCETSTIPTAKKYREVQFSTVKRRSGRESIPFLGLEAGTYRVRFYNNRKEAVLTIETWLSIYGWAWRVIGS